MQALVPFDLKNSPKDRKVVAVQELKRVGQSIRKIAELTGIPKKSVERYVKIDPKDLENYDYWRHYEDSVKKIWFDQDTELVAMATQRMKETLPKAKLYQATGVFKTVRELNQPQNGASISVQGDQVAVQVVEGDVSYNAKSESNEGK